MKLFDLDGVRCLDIIISHFVVLWAQDKENLILAIQIEHTQHIACIKQKITTCHFAMLIYLNI